MPIRSANINVMAQAAHKAARHLVRDFGEVENLQVSIKGPGDYVSAADHRAEQILHQKLSRARPGFGFMMEERGAVEGQGDQRWIVELAADRAPFICQGQPINLYLPADVDKWDLHMLHWTAWKRGVKSLYYCRSKSISRAAFAGKLADGDAAAPQRALPQRTDYEECLACQ